MTTKPSNLSFTEAAALPLVYCTVHDALVKHGKLPFNPSEEERGKRSVLILGGSSGTGSIAIQMAKKMGLVVVTTCSAKNVDFVRGLGADEASDDSVRLLHPVDCTRSLIIGQNMYRKPLHNPIMPLSPSSWIVWAGQS
jgi:NADPH:quinone reductase-like Zn-dependent oxidoreductase